MMQVHQFHGVVAYGDAIGNDILNLREMLRKLGYASEIFAEYPQRNYESKARHLNEYRKFSAPANVLLCHFSIGYSTNVLQWLQRMPDRKVLIYHNITPHTYFAGVSDVYYEETYTGRKQLAQLCPLTVAGWGDSDFNRRELAGSGWQQTSVLPIVIDPSMVQIKPDRNLLRQLNRDRSLNVLFVSRVVPNKKIEDVIVTFYYLKKFI